MTSIILGILRGGVDINNARIKNPVLWICVYSAFLTIFAADLISQRPEIIVGTDSVMRTRMFNGEQWLPNVLNEFLNIPYDVFLPVGASSTAGRMIAFNEPIGQILISNFIDHDVYLDVVEISYYCLLVAIFATCLSFGIGPIYSLTISAVITINPYLNSLLFTNSESIISLNLLFSFIALNNSNLKNSSGGGLTILLPIAACLFRYEAILIILPYVILANRRVRGVLAAVSEASFIIGAALIMVTSISMFYFSDLAYFLSHPFPSMFIDNGSTSNLEVGVNFDIIQNMPLNIIYTIFPVISGVIAILLFLPAVRGYKIPSESDWILTSTFLTLITIFSLNSFYGHGEFTLMSSYGRYSVYSQILITILVMKIIYELVEKLDQGKVTISVKIRLNEYKLSRFISISAGVLIISQSIFNIHSIYEGPDGIDDQNFASEYYRTFSSDFDSLEGRFVLVGSNSNFFYHSQAVISLEQIPIENRLNATFEIFEQLDYFGYSIYAMRASLFTEAVILDLMKSDLIKVDDVDGSPRIVKLTVMPA